MGPLVLPLGARIGGCYQVCSLIGEGGFSQVYEAEDVSLRRRVAIKVNTCRETGGDELRREAQALAAVRHAGLPVVHAIGVHDDQPFLVKERLYGVSLEDDLDRLRAAGGQFPLPEAIDILVALADVLAEVHHAGLAHRDVKPANMILCPRGRVAEIETEPTMCGTPRYMAPELIAREVAPGNAHLLDTYGFGAVACELLTGQPPYDAGSLVEILEKHLGGTLPDIAAARPEAPPELVALIRACLARDPEERPPAIDAVGWELRAQGRQLRGQTTLQQRVLIVDDDQDCAELMRDCVAGALKGAHIRVVGSCEAALEVVRREPPTLMLLDIGLPGMSGVDLCLRLKAMRLARKTDIVVVSGLVDDHSRRTLRQAGVRHLVSKGAALPERLGGVIHQVGRSHRPVMRG
jgi:CheY-like chemotaxis protein